MKSTLFFKLFTVFSFFFFLKPFESFAFPIYAQQAYENPREANGRIVCANCHLAQKPTLLEAPATVLPNSVFETVVKIPYDKSKQQITGNGQKGGLNVGAVMILPEGFKLATKAQLSEELKEKTKGVYITPYSPTKENILVVGPINGDKNSEITFPLYSPNPETTKNVFFAKYPIYVGANRGRGQLYPTGEKTNNNMFNATTSGVIQSITPVDKGTEIVIVTANQQQEKQILPKGAEIIVKENQKVVQDQALTTNPNVGGFGQNETEIVLQNPLRIYSYIAFCFTILVTQAMFVFKKKQFEKVQISELDF